MKGNNKDYGKIFWVHLPFVLIAYLSPLFFSWYYVLIGAIILQSIQLIMKGCIFTIIEFGRENNKITCIGYYLKKWKIIKKNTRFTKIFIRYISRAIVVLIALIIQVLLGYKPLLF